MVEGQRQGEPCACGQGAAAGSPCAAGQPAASPPADPALRQSLAYCHAITRRHARNFYYGLRLTPEPKRTALYTTYAFMRACDDLADGPAAGPTAPAGPPALEEVRLTRERIERFRRTMQAVLDGGPLPAQPAERSVWPAFRYVTQRFRLRPELLHAMLDGQLCDLEQTAYQTFDQLYAYCYKVASVVGLVCVDIWGNDGSAEVDRLAEARGVAFQLTNIIRDVYEDAQRGRTYLPAEDFERFGCDPALILRRQGDASFDRLMRFQIERAFDYYQRSEPLEGHLDPACRPTSWALLRIYRGLLEKIARDPRQVLRKRVRLSRWRKIAIAARAGMKRAKSE